MNDSNSPTRMTHLAQPLIATGAIVLSLKIRTLEEESVNASYSIRKCNQNLQHW